MAAIITEQFRRNNAKILLNDIVQSEYYVGIGQQDEWDDVELGAPYPKGTYGDERRALEHLIGLFKVANNNSSLVIPKVDLESGTEYKVFDPQDPTCFYPDVNSGTRPCYAVLSPNSIYLCIDKEDGATTMNDPAQSVNLLNFEDYGYEKIDGYTWCYIGRYDNFDNINTADFISINASSTPSSNIVNSKASVLVNPDGIRNDLLFTAVQAGDSGNNLAVQLLRYDADDSPTPANPNIPSDSPSALTTPGEINVDEEIDGGLSIQKIYFAPGTTSQQLEDWFGSLATGESPLLLESLGQSDGELSSTEVQVLSGGNSNNTVIKEATGGLVYGFTVINGGSGYQDGATSGVQTGSAVANLIGTGENGVSRETQIDIDFSFDADSGEILSVKPSDSSSLTAKGFVEARIDFDASYAPFVANPPTESAVIIPSIAPIEGFGYDKSTSLPLWYVGVYADTSKADFTPTGTKYHQVSLIKNPLKPSGEVITGEYVQPLRSFSLGVAGDGFELSSDVLPGWKIFQGDNQIGVFSFTQNIENDANRVALDPVKHYYYSDHLYGYTPIEEGSGVDTITFVSPDGLTTIDPARTPNTTSKSVDYLEKSGTMIFQDNRASIIRSEGQNEELKLIIQL